MDEPVRAALAQSALAYQGTRGAELTSSISTSHEGDTSMPATIAASVPQLEQMVIDITQEIHVRSSLTATFAALLDEMGPLNQGHEGAAMPMKLEAWPG